MNEEERHRGSGIGNRSPGPESRSTPGLYVVSTPIGNLEDITLRALRVLKEADFIICEDTRHTGMLLKHYGIKARTISFHDQNKLRRTPELLEMLRQGKSLALTSDAGTPGVSDPGFYLIRAAVEKGFHVIPIPGASALLSAIVPSGLPCDHFVFEGFLPRRDGKKLKRLNALAQQERTMVFFESAHRVVRTLKQMQEIFGERTIVVARELTKKFEEFLRGTTSDLLKQLEERQLRGEVTLIVAGHRNAKDQEELDEEDDESTDERPEPGSEVPSFTMSNTSHSPHRSHLSGPI
jgi:16S rRNA (cytidine1402-2'-O)-methyltransferase